MLKIPKCVFQTPTLYVLLSAWHFHLGISDSKCSNLNLWTPNLFFLHSFLSMVKFIFLVPKPWSHHIRCLSSSYNTKPMHQKIQLILSLKYIQNKPPFSYSNALSLVQATIKSYLQYYNNSSQISKILSFLDHCIG